MKILELFAGSCSFTKVAKRLGHETFATDIKDYKYIDLKKDIFQLNYKEIPFYPDLIWASPPCTTFSVASIGSYWKGGKGAYVPKKAEAYIGIALVQKAKDIIEYYKPKYYYIENPRGVLRKLYILKQYERKTITYCSYGDDRMKPSRHNPWSGGE